MSNRCIFKLGGGFLCLSVIFVVLMFFCRMIPHYMSGFSLKTQGRKQMISFLFPTVILFPPDIIIVVHFKSKHMNTRFQVDALRAGLTKYL